MRNLKKGSAPLTSKTFLTARNHGEIKMSPDIAARPNMYFFVQVVAKQSNI